MSESFQPSVSPSQMMNPLDDPSALRVPLIFDQSRPGAMAISIPHSGVPETPIEQILPHGMVRQQKPRLPETSQLEVVRHFTQLSHLNHCIDSGFYPLGSCTMKYNPKLCDSYANHPGLHQIHPLTPEHLSQGALEIIYKLQTFLQDVTGFHKVTLQPAAGAQGELLGMMMIKAYFRKQGESHRTEVIIPDSAHGTNPASAAMCGFDVVQIRSHPETGLVDLDELRRAISPKTAAIMLTNPNTVGLFERDILTIGQLIHDAGGLLYYDGANLNAIMGHAKPAHMGFDVMHINTHKTFATPHGGGGPGSGPVAVGETLAPFLPVPQVVFDGDQYSLDFNYPDTIGKVKLFYGNFEMMVRAYSYILAHGGDGLKQVSTDAVLNANYVKEQLKDSYRVPYNSVCKHEFVMTSELQKEKNSALNTMAIVKRLMDFGIHPPTVYFPLIVYECMMIEPTETESKETLDQFISAMKAIAKECETTPDVIIGAPWTTPVRKVDEVRAARQPDLNYFGAH